MFKELVLFYLLSKLTFILLNLSWHLTFTNFIWKFCTSHFLLNQNLSNAHAILNLWTDFHVFKIGASWPWIFYILFEFHVTFSTDLRSFWGNNSTFNSATHLFNIFSLRSFLEVFEQTTLLSIQLLTFLIFSPSAPS